MPCNPLMEPDKSVVTGGWLTIIEAAVATEVNEVLFVPFWNDVRWN